MRILVTGGRDYTDRANVYRTLDEVHARYEITELIHGACPYGGADILAEDWAKDREIEYRGIPAKFKKIGGRAGPIRNQRMIDDFGPHILVVFPGGRGTADTRDRARSAGLHIIESVPATGSQA